jgi:hypothetical protein
VPFYIRWSGMIPAMLISNMVGEILPSFSAILLNC